MKKVTEWNADLEEMKEDGRIEMTRKCDESWKRCTRLGQLVLGTVQWRTADLEVDELNEVAVAGILQEMGFMQYGQEMVEDFGQWWSDIVSDVTHEMKEARETPVTSGMVSSYEDDLED